VPANALVEVAGVGFGTFSVPRIGAYVFVFFEGWAYNQPVYFAEATDGVHGLPAFRTTHYPNRKGVRFENGVEVFFDESNDHIRINHPSGTYIEVVQDGTVRVYSMKDIEGTAEQDIKLTALRDVTVQATRDIGVLAGGNIDITATGVVTITGATVLINP
jgi:hypothetical protein